MSAVKHALVISLGLFALLAATTVAAHAVTPDEVKRMVVEEALNSRVPPALALAVAKVESGFRDDVASEVGARGVMQIMPATARGEFDLPADRLWDARTNIRVGLKYLERLHHQYGGDWRLALSHYNGGTLKGAGATAIPHTYTAAYVRDVMAWRARFERGMTVAAMTREAKPSVRVADTSAGATTVDYWMMTDPSIEKDWRHYLKIADAWLAGGPAQEAEAAVTVPDERASARWERRIENRRQSFRQRLDAEEARWPTFGGGGDRS